MGRRRYNFDIENIVYKSENVAHCEVVGIETEHGYSIPVVHIIKEETYKGNDEDLIKEIYTLCCEHLEEDSIPYGYKICTSFPVKASGKRDIEKIKQDREEFVVIENGKLKNIVRV